MIIKILIAVGFLFMTVALSIAQGQTTQDYADKLYSEWNHATIPGDSGGSQIGYFNNLVPDSLKGEVLDRLLDRACATQPKKASEVIENIESILNVMGSQIKIPPHLDQNLYALTKDPEPFACIGALHTLQELGRPQDHDIIVAALDNSNDDVRSAAFGALFGRPDADAATYQQYLQNHQDDPSYAKSVKFAKGGLNNLTKSNGK